MTVHELIQHLQSLPPGVAVRLNGPDGEYEVDVEKVQRRVYEAACLVASPTNAEETR